MKQKTKSSGVRKNNLGLKKAELLIKGQEVFGGVQEFENWLNSSNIALGDKIPAQLMNTLDGINLIDELLEAMSFGNVV